MSDSTKLRIGDRVEYIGTATRKKKMHGVVVNEPRRDSYNEMIVGVRYDKHVMPVFEYARNVRLAPAPSISHPSREHPAKHRGGDKFYIKGILEKQGRGEPLSLSDRMLLSEEFPSAKPTHCALCGVEYGNYNKTLCPPCFAVAAELGMQRVSVRSDGSIAYSTDDGDYVMSRDEFNHLRKQLTSRGNRHMLSSEEVDTIKKKHRGGE